MRFDRLDLNLLVALDALLELKSVTDAAQKLHLTQSGISAALAKLRAYFDDELLVKDGRHMLLTARAEQLIPRVRDALLQIRSTITLPAVFDPSVSQRHFTIVCSDYVAMTLISRLLQAADHEAPKVTFSLISPDRHSLELFERGDIDLLITVAPQVRENHPQRLLFEDAAVGVCWTGNTEVGKQLDMETFLRLGHVAATFGEARAPSFYERLLGDRGVNRRVEISVQSFSVVPTVLIGTHRIGVMHHRHAEFFAQFLPLRLLALPIDLPPAREIAQWHRLRGTEPGLEWLISRLTRLGADLAV